MKRVNNIYNSITDLYNIMHIYDYIIRKNTKNKKKLEEFENFYSQNLVNIKEELIKGSYIPGRYNIFLIHEKKYRIIMSQSIKDKIVNHLVANYFLIDIFDKTLINNNVATRKNKGTHYGLRLFKKYLNNMKKEHKIFYVLKFDINKYFYNIDHDIVKKILNNKIKDEKALNILYNIIDSTDSKYINEEIDVLKNNEIKKLSNSNVMNKDKLIKEIIDIPIYNKGKGFPIGNMTSQIIAIIYLNELDYFIRDKLKIKYYIRYMDDGVLIHEDKNYLKYCLNEIEKILDKYKVKLNKKTKIYNINEGIEFLGFRFIVNNNKVIMKLKNSTKKRLKKNINDNNMSSYIGHLSHGNCKNLIYRIVRNNT